MSALKQFNITPEVQSLKFDFGSVVNLYDRVRELYPHTFLLEATDYLPDENCFSYIGLNPIATFKVTGESYLIEDPAGQVSVNKFDQRSELITRFADFQNLFNYQDQSELGIANGFFGYLAYDAVQYFDSLDFKPASSATIPEAYYHIYEFIFAVNHYRQEAYILKNKIAGLEFSKLSINDLIQLIARQSQQKNNYFKVNGEVRSNLTDQQHQEIILNCQKHIQRGDIFQVVPSRSYSQDFLGDDYLVYRALRQINPSPYLFYFDFGTFRIFGSSPEADLIIKDRQALINPIAGTCPNYENLAEREQAIKELVNDPKENSEHVMLVDLARNDLNKNCDQVRVDKYKEVQVFSHVIHLVSEVSGKLKPEVSAFQLLADTFPAGTLTGAPKFRAMQIIDQQEPDRREFYGGAIGLLGFNGDCVHAIMIRSFLSRNFILTRRAGGGVVSESKVEAEITEVRNKLGALEKAIRLAAEPL